MEKLPTLQNAGNVNKSPMQLHDGTGLPYVSTWMINRFQNFHDRLNKTEGALSITNRRKTSGTEIKKPRLPQDVFLEVHEDHDQTTNTKTYISL